MSELPGAPVQASSAATTDGNRQKTKLTLGEAAHRWLGTGSVNVLIAVTSPSLVLTMLADAARGGQLEVLDSSHPEPARWIASVESLRAFGATRQCMPEFLEDGRQAERPERALDGKLQAEAVRSEAGRDLAAPVAP